MTWELVGQVVVLLIALIAATLCTVVVTACVVVAREMWKASKQ